MINVLAKAIHHTVEFGDFNIFVISCGDGKEHVVLTRGNIENKDDIFCRISSECLPGTALFSAECDCKQQIEYSLKCISEANQGIFIYLRQEGRGHGLTKKIQALANKNKGLDTFSAVECMGLPADIRHYSIVKDILDYFKIESIICISNNPEKVKSLKQEGVKISKVINIPVSCNQYSIRHLRAKQSRGHHIEFK